MKYLSRFIPSGARIVLVILVAIVLPSVLLSVLAIWAIGAERSHMQDRIRDEAQGLTRKVVDATLLALSAARTDIADQAAQLKNSEAAAELLKKVRLTHAYVSHVVLVDEHNAVVYPPVPRHETMISIASAPAEVHDSLNKPQNLEFVQCDLDAAEAAYRETFEAAVNPTLRVSALLGLARVRAKSGRWRKAIDTYQSAVEEYGAQREENGLMVGPAAALRIAEIAFENAAPDEFAQSGQELLSAHAEVQKHRAQLTQEEANFFDKQLTSLTEKFIEKNTGSPAQNSRLRSMLALIAARSRHEALAMGAALRLAGIRDQGLGVRDQRLGVSAESYSLSPESYLLLCAPVVIAGRQFVACALAPVHEVEHKLIAAEVERLATREEVGIVITHERRGNVAGEAPGARSFRLGGSVFPEPLSDLRAEAYLKGYESLAALSNIRTNIYVWAVALAITGIIAGAIVTYVSVSRTMRAAELKSDFVSNVTHELKTPLTSIRMFAETLYDGRVKDEQDAKECLETIVSESERLSRLIDKVLDFRAIEKGKRKFDFRQADLRKVILSSLETFRRQMRGCEATVYVNIPSDLPHVRMDPDAIGEVLLNLLTNAYKYSPSEDRRIWVKVQAGGGTARVSVEDRGIGIPKRELKAVFEKFYRVDDLLTREVDGTGLGLTISRYVAQAHGGSIGVESKEGKGSKFTLVLKL
jgi:signal transduction histidine kinase/tetratricopeptide (TPR) repeat protein